MLATLLKGLSEEEIEKEPETDVVKTEEERQKEKESKKEAVRKKIKAVAKMSLVFKTLRQERETINELKQKMGTESLPPGTLYDGAQGIQKGQKELFASFPPLI